MSRTIAALVNRLRTGEYDGADIMQAWIVLESNAAMLATIKNHVEEARCTCEDFEPICLWCQLDGHI